MLRLLEGCYNHRAIAECRELFTDDFRFVCSVLDTAGAPYRGTAWTREDEISWATHLFAGGDSLPPARNIRLTLDKNFFVLRDDSFSSADPTARAHKTVRTQVRLTIETGEGNTFEVSGADRFYLVRGDFALIPAEMRNRGFGSDSTRWYIRRWEDETTCPSGAVPAIGFGANDQAPRWMRGLAASDSICPTWCAIKLAYR